MTLNEMRSLLESRGIQLTKSLGQNFLHDGNQLRRIASAAEIVSTDRILEVGPGLGPLTELLLVQAASVLAIEKDARLVSVLRENFSGALSGQGQAPSNCWRPTPCVGWKPIRGIGAVGNSSPICPIRWRQP